MSTQISKCLYFFRRFLSKNWGNNGKNLILYPIQLRMRRKGLLIYWLASVLLSWTVGLPLGAQERSYMEQLSVDEGLPHTDVSSIVQDSDG